MMEDVAEGKEETSIENSTVAVSDLLQRARDGVCFNGELRTASSDPGDTG
jgi:hypothetical protein